MDILQTSSSVVMIEALTSRVGFRLEDAKSPSYRGTLVKTLAQGRLESLTKQ